MIPPDDQVCVLVRDADGTETWESLSDYSTNPPQGTYVIRDSRKVKGAENGKQVSQ